MSQVTEFKEQFDGLMRTIETFKDEHKKEIAELKKGLSASDQKEKLDKLSEALDKTEEKLNKLSASHNRVEQPTAVEASNAKEKAAKAAFNRYARQGAMGIEGRKQYLEAFDERYNKHHDFQEMKTMATDDDPAGGWLVRPEMDNEIVKKITESSPMREICDVRQIATDSLEILARTTRGGSGGWVGERETRGTSSTPSLSKMVFNTHEIYSEPVATQKQLDDSFFDVEAFLRDEVSEDFAIDESTAFVAGNGVKKPQGITQYTSGSTWGTIEQVGSGSAGAFTANGLIQLQDSLFEAFQPGAKWLMARASRTAIRKLVNSQGEYMWSVEGGLNNGVQTLLLGKPIVLAADMPAIASGALSAAYGDFKKGYVIVDRIGTRVLRDPYTSKGSVLFYTTKRVGGGVKNFQAIKLQVLT